MSLVGSLEDLGLGDILQIIHLSGKSGILVLRSESGEAEVIFDRGLIRAAYRKQGPTTLTELLQSREVAPADALADAAEDARNLGRSLVDVLDERGLADEEAIDAIRSENIESALLEAFRWPTGDFSFEVRGIQDDSDEFYATPGVNPQFIALEGTRMFDEQGFADDDAADAPAGESLDGAHRVAEATAQAEAPVAADSSLSMLSETDLLAPEPEFGLEAEADGEALLEAVALEDRPAVVDAEPASDVIAADVEPVVRVPAGPPPSVIVVDPDLRVLEWAKAALADTFPQVHIFQRTDLAIARIRQYLARTQVPLVVLSSDVPTDPISGAEGPFELLRRLRRQSAQMPVAILAPVDRDIASPTDARPGAVVCKPSQSELADPRRVDECQRYGSTLAQELLALAQSGTASERRAAAPDAAAIARLHETSARIREGAAQGEVLPQVLAFASETFARVALFMIRDTRALGIGQVGLNRAGGPDEAALREIHLDAREPAWFRTVLDTRAPYCGTPSDEGDQRLAVMLGNDIPAEAYVAPIKTADRIVAILYGDNLPSRAPIGETAALEVVIDSAGIALERTLLERELAAAEQ